MTRSLKKKRFRMFLEDKFKKSNVCKDVEIKEQVSHKKKTLAELEEEVGQIENEIDLLEKEVELLAKEWGINLEKEEI